LEPRFQGEGVVSEEYFLVSTKLDTFCYLTANCSVLCAIVLTQYRRVTDGQTDGNAIASIIIIVIKYSACNASIAACCKNELCNNVWKDTSS